jgi:hypothetical protein
MRARPAAVVTTVLAATAPAAAEPTATAPVCTLGFGYPRCRTIPVLDVGVRTSPGVEPIGESSPLSVTLELGMIVNLSRHHSVGVVGGFLFDADYPGATVRARYRHWPRTWWPLEVSAGVLIDRGGPHDVGGAGLIVESATSFVDTIALTAAVELRSTGDGDGEAALFVVGLRGGLQTLAVPSYLLPNW